MVSGTLTIQHSIVEALTNYEFTSDLTITWERADLQARFDGVYEAPGRYKGTFTSAGSLPTGLDAPESEVVAIDQTVWWRAPGGAWKDDTAYEERDGFHPFLLFAEMATPAFFVNGLDFDEIALPYAGSYEMIYEVETYPPIELHKDDLIGFLDVGRFTKEGDKDPTIVREDAESYLPEDMTITVWLAREGLYPVRILVELSAREDDEFRLFMDNPVSVRLQMDITDPNVNVQIEPPMGQ